MQFLLTNDDGIDAPGLGALTAAVRGLGEPVVVAPAGPQRLVEFGLGDAGAGVLGGEEAVALPA